MTKNHNNKKVVRCVPGYLRKDAKLFSNSDHLSYSFHVMHWDLNKEQFDQNKDSWRLINGGNKYTNSIEKIKSGLEAMKNTNK